MCLVHWGGGGGGGGSDGAGGYVTLTCEFSSERKGIFEVF